jgi:hypothetical protein
MLLVTVRKGDRFEREPYRIKSSGNSSNQWSRSFIGTSTNNNIKKCTMLGGSNSELPSSCRGLDGFLQAMGKDLPVGAKIRLRLIQGPPAERSLDPVERSAQPQAFPSILKFPPASTQPPNFAQSPWNTGHGRLHMETVPKPVEDSDEEDNEKQNSGSNGEQNAAKTGKKRWRYNRNAVAQKQWVLQDQVDFLETMIYRRKQAKYQKMLSSQKQKSADSLPPPPVPPPIRSTRYEGIPERMTSHNVLFSLQKSPATLPPDPNEYDDEHSAAIVVRTLPSLDHPVMVPMNQPAARSHTAFSSLANAAQVMEDQRFAMSTTAASFAFRNARSTVHSTTTVGNTDLPLRIGGIRKMNQTQSRLLQKLQQKEKSAANLEEEDGDDVMADVAFKERKGVGGSGRRELLSTLGDGLKVSDDGNILGGANDALFGGRGVRFGRLAVANDSGTTAGAAGTGDAGGNNERGADGAAMADDFYTRDVGAEYDEMDYDAQEQFDDDDVDVGETEVVGDGFGNDDDFDEDEDDDSDEDEDDDDDDALNGAEGLASTAGYKALLAKARGEVAVTATDKQDESRTSSPTAGSNAGMANNGAPNVLMKNGDERDKRSLSPKPDASSDAKPIDHLAKKMAAAEKSVQAIKEKQKPKEPVIGSVAEPVAQVDENGLRLITLDAVRREIWLNHGSIPINRLIKIFSANKKHGEARQSKFREVVKELCTMITDPLKGRILVLKQHYSHMN